ncbi:unnamed protein product [Peronospora belbahrii]|uniref:Uncharacterized protein n=1 Tax=Peronospora belbahrii TaxID=622444 RepID=A0AAU9L878_9STRA|nr:unnamed protein product [Peronospora belbahrii]CAH0521883.1 unnamed protein product [Peronospora belbahrii]
MIMIPSGLLYDTPVFMQPASCCNNQDLLCCLHDPESNVKLVVLHEVAERTVVIQTANGEHELIVVASGGCFFESSVLGMGEEFKVKDAANGLLVFVSCRTGNVLESDENGLPRCVDTISRGWVLWHHTISNSISGNTAVKAVRAVESLCNNYSDVKYKNAEIIL